MKISKKIITLVLLLAVAVTFLAVSPTKSRMKSYYSGDAISFNGKIHIGSTNTGNLELFVVENDSIYKKATIVSSDRIAPDFLDLKFVKENNQLYVYAVNGRYLYKYDITNPIAPKVIEKIKDNSWDWFTKVDVVNGKLVTVGSKGVKIWNGKYQVIDAYKMVDEKDSGAISFSTSGNFIISAKDKLNIFSVASRNKVAEFAIASNDKTAVRTPLNDSKTSMIYVVDDESLKAVNFAGQVVREFKHISNVGYDVADSSNANYLYFSDGLGVVKVRKSDLQPVDWAYTTRLGIPGSWAMGMESVLNNSKENIVVFNGSNILVLDDSMQAVSHYESTEKEIRPIEDLVLGIDKNRAAPGTDVSVRGQGFGLNETLEIEIARTKFQAQSDSEGRFKQIITVPSVLPKKADIKVTGKTSGRTYSIAFEIE